MNICMCVYVYIMYIMYKLYMDVCINVLYCMLKFYLQCEEQIYIILCNWCGWEINVN